MACQLIKSQCLKKVNKSLINRMAAMIFLSKQHKSVENFFCLLITKKPLHKEEAFSYFTVLRDLKQGLRRIRMNDYCAP